MILSRLGALDLDRAATLHAASFVPLGERAWTRQDFAELLASPGVEGFLLEIGGSDAGVALCRIAADEAELLTIAVASPYRRQGAGGRLLGAVVERVRASGARSLFLEVAGDNGPARNLYESWGFVPVGSRRDYYRRTSGDAADAIVMRFSLS